ncbi:FAD-binding oxidoreductase [Xanthomonas massiliensis]|uniref:FAD-binding oxidoreductase n=1 Tax=Xanthomonas massiliensis TaxID=1720302 RepID=UPI000826D3A3|nr:FAD-binding oxidoreductase [Xanthomonas massiliensis]
MSRAEDESWGRFPRGGDQRHLWLHDRNAALSRPDSGSMLVRGNGRSYGDSCLNPGGTLLHARPMDRFIAFDPGSGLLRCECGVTLSEVIDLVLPQGWFLPVTPGTRFATVGGAIANDVHGKNHHSMGNFGHHVRRMELLRSDGTRLELSPQADDDRLFAATIGGLGLTGLITWAEIQLRRVPGPWLESESIRFGNLDDFFTLSAESARTCEYTVAWIDCLASGKRLGRGHFLRSDHAASIAEECPRVRDSHRVMPFTPPFSLVNPLSLRAFNTLYYWRQPRRCKRAISHYQSYFYPLDGIGHWNRMYGPRGFMQHQCVLPPATAREGVAALLREIAHSGQGSFLAVLKEFGTIASIGMLSFPRPGTTLALDFPNGGPDVFRLLDRLDAIVAEAGGAIYPAKDARMSPAVFRGGYPRLQEFCQYVDPAFSSGLWRRLTEHPCNVS